MGVPGVEEVEAKGVVPRRKERTRVWERKWVQRGVRGRRSGRLSFDFSPRALPSCPLFSSPPFTSPTFTANSFSSPACPFSPPVSPSFLPSCLRVRTPCPSSRLSPLLHLPLLPTSALLLRPLPPLLLPLASHPRFPFPSLRLPSLLRHPFPFHVAARRHCPHLRKPSH
ncbi:unnamed protein product [Closterium sp. NIES-65]|nr:unnamed protein product [Closterium sp. NIES-65]